MINIHEVLETNNMIEHENLDVRTVTIGISLLDCATEDVDTTCRNICDKIRRTAGNLKKTAEDIATEKNTKGFDFETLWVIRDGRPRLKIFEN